MEGLGLEAAEVEDIFGQIDASDSDFYFDFVSYHE